MQFGLGPIPQYESRISRRMDVLASVPGIGLPFLAYNIYRNRDRFRAERQWLDNPNLETFPYNPDHGKIWNEQMIQVAGLSVAVFVPFVLFGVAYGVNRF